MITGKGTLHRNVLGHCSPCGQVCSTQAPARRAAGAAAGPVEVDEKFGSALYRLTGMQAREESGRRHVLTSEGGLTRTVAVSVASTQDVMDRYFAAMGAGEDFSRFFDADVTWLMLDSGQEVRGPTAVRDYILELHNAMHGGDQRELVVADGHALLEGTSWADAACTGPELTYCLVYDIANGQIQEMRCYGTAAQLTAGTA